jgi:hypothetical protein
MKLAPSLALAGLTVACSVPNIVGYDEAGADAALDGTAKDASEGGTYCGVSGISRPDKCCPMNVPCYGMCTNPGCAACGQCAAGTVCCSPMGSTGNCFSTCQ